MGITVHISMHCVPNFATWYQLYSKRKEKEYTLFSYVPDHLIRVCGSPILVQAGCDLQMTTEWNSEMMLLHLEIHACAAKCLLVLWQTLSMTSRLRSPWLVTRFTLFEVTISETSLCVSRLAVNHCTCWIWRVQYFTLFRIHTSYFVIMCC